MEMSEFYFRRATNMSTQGLSLEVSTFKWKLTEFGKKMRVRN
jgi:hypothetical protein